ncbi:hypothetical protein B0H17DRAFT_1066183 [Mycena rosella]|uniref:Uncharacterized protein n=1 Tax=Mycena rosella TaxID=1033263 RepID=A0AAD7GDH8_MYCRO|nr:hypothetical protein B0H17DRAFT_1066183 [Mycena rosella]
MKFFALFLLAAPLVSALTPDDYLHVLSDEANALSFDPLLGPEYSPFVDDDAVPEQPPSILKERETNALRFARGLPPLPPRALRPTRVDHAARGGPSPIAISSQAIQITDLSGNFVGYVSHTPNYVGEYGPTTDINQALSMSATVPADGTPFSILTPLGNPAYPYFGGVHTSSTPQGTSLTATSSNYVWIAGTSETSAGSVALAQGNAWTAYENIQRDIESAIWTYNFTTKQIIPRWVNADGSEYRSVYSMSRLRMC